MNALELMKKRLQYRGGTAQQDRMIRDKRVTLDRAVLYSYQGARINHLGVNEKVPALVNPDKTKQNYDDKILSVGYEYNFVPGDIFEWQNTNSKWLIYLQDMTELAYFRGEIRRCRYQASWKDENGDIQTTYFAVRGPVETKINFIQKNGISVDEPNHSLNILMPKNKATLSYFQRYSKFYLRPLDEGDVDICYRVEARDSISMVGILEITAVEYYSNEFEDDKETGIVGGLIIEPIPPEPASAAIQGETFIRPKKTYTYVYTGNAAATWHIPEDAPVKYTINEDNSISLQWLATYNGQFVLSFGEEQKTIVAESLF